jgi:hypothetical protein
MASPDISQCSEGLVHLVGRAALLRRPNIRAKRQLRPTKLHWGHTLGSHLNTLGSHLNILHLRLDRTAGPRGKMEAWLDPFEWSGRALGISRKCQSQLLTLFREPPRSAETGAHCLIWIASLLRSSPRALRPTPDGRVPNRAACWTRDQNLAWPAFLGCGGAARRADVWKVRNACS